MNRSVSFYVAGLLSGILIATLGFALLMGDSENENHATVLKLGHSLDTAHPVHAGMMHMAERLEVHSGGRLVLEIYPNGQLGSETECIEQLQQGALAMTKTSAAPLEGFVPEMGVFGIPYIFRDAEHYWRVLEGPIGNSWRCPVSESGCEGSATTTLVAEASTRSIVRSSRPRISWV
jgi:TRAP-type C4-dicarboxylate transport system substrate-binding protein